MCARAGVDGELPPAPPGGEDGEGDEVDVAEAIDVEEVRDEGTAARLSFFDVVLPLPGDAVTYPPNLKAVYEQLARDKLGLALDQFKVHQPLRDACTYLSPLQTSRHRLAALRGGYRTIAVLPTDVKYAYIREVARHQCGCPSLHCPASQVLDPTEPLITSDLDRLLGRPRRDVQLGFSPPVNFAQPPQQESPAATGDSAPHTPAASPESEGPAAEVPKDRNDGPGAATGGNGRDAALRGNAAVLLSCSLPRSAYLTMALREVLEASKADGTEK